MNDAELIPLLLQGSNEGFKILVEAYQNRVYNTVLGFVQNEDDADDITQEVFIKIFRNIEKFRQESKLSTWIYRMSVHQSIDFLRQQKRSKRTGWFSGLFSVSAETIEPVDWVHPGVLTERKEQSKILFGAINTLPENQKTAFLLQKIEDCSQQQIAEIMQLSEGAVESLLSRAKANLKKQLTNYYKKL